MKPSNSVPYMPYTGRYISISSTSNSKKAALFNLSVHDLSWFNRSNFVLNLALKRFPSQSTCQSFCYSINCKFTDRKKRCVQPRKLRRKVLYADCPRARCPPRKTEPVGEATAKAFLPTLLQEQNKLPENSRGQLALPVRPAGMIGIPIPCSTARGSYWPSR